MKSCDENSQGVGNELGKPLSTKQIGTIVAWIVGGGLGHAIGDADVHNETAPSAANTHKVATDSQEPETFLAHTCICNSTCSNDAT